MMGFLLLHCGSTKQITPEEYSTLQPQDRIRYLNAKIEKDPGNVELKKLLYREYLNLEMTPQALDVMQEVQLLTPYDMDVKYEYGVLQYEEGNHEEAYRAFLTIMESSSAELYKSRISKYVSSGYRLQQITFDSADEGFPVFSPDGTKILYQKKVNENWDIIEYNIASQSQNVVVSTPADEELPVYAPQSARIIYTTNEDDRRPIDAKLKAREIASMDLNDGYIAKLTQSVADDWLPRFDRSGTYVLFTSDRSDLRKVSFLEKNSDVFIMETDGSFQQQLTDSPANEGGGCFSADGTHIFFHSNRNGTYDIFEMRKNGSQVMTLIDNSNGNDVNPYASADGQYLVFVSDRDGNYELYRARTDGSEQERLTFDRAVDSSPLLSADGSVVAFHSNRNGNYDIFLLNLAASSSQSTMTTSELITRLGELAN
jgi:Tol biopolymer transport system component